MSRVTGLHVIDTLPVSLDGCPDQWNLTTSAPDNNLAPDTWWLHVPIYEVSYMWYSGLACCIVVVLGSILSLVPGLQQEEYPDQDLLVPVKEVSLTFTPEIKDLFFRFCFAAGHTVYRIVLRNILRKGQKLRKNLGSKS